MNYLYRTYTSNNPAGVQINLGYYALAECIIKGTYASVALSRWCGLKQDADRERHYKGKITLDVEKLKKIFKERFLTYRNLAEMTGKSNTFFIRMFNGKHKYYPYEIVYTLEEELGLKKGSLVKGEMK